MYNYQEFRKWAKEIIGDSFDEKWSYYQTLKKLGEAIQEGAKPTSTSGTSEPTGGKNGDIYIQTIDDEIVNVWFNINGKWEASGSGVSDVKMFEAKNKIVSNSTITIREEN